MRSTSITSSQVILGSPATMQGVSNVCPFQPTQGRLARSRLAGFTLIELLIVVAIVAILAAIAIPSYEKYVLRSHRTSAKTALFDLAGREERYYATNNTYDATLADFGYAVDGTGAVQVPNNTNEDYYGVTIAVTQAVGTTPASYVATATPTTNQSADSCGSYTLTDLGVQGNSGSDTGPSGCW